MTQEQLAEKLGVDRSAIAKWETGKALPRTEMLFKIAEVFNCSINDLFDGDPNTDETLAFQNQEAIQ